MSKIRKLFFNPGVYWRDFLLKRYPLQPSLGFQCPEKTLAFNNHADSAESKSTMVNCQVKTTSTEIKNDTDDFDFYFVTAHGVGEQSFQRYMREIGLEIAFSDKIYDEETACIKKINALRQKVTRVGLGIGAMPKADIPLLAHERPVYWLVNDPVRILSSIVNHHSTPRIQHLLMKFGKNHTSLEYEMKSCLADGFVKDIAYYRNYIRNYLFNRDGDKNLNFSSMIKSIKNPLYIHLIDTADISGENINKTMDKIASDFSLSINNQSYSIFKKTRSSVYNYFRNIPTLRINIEMGCYLLIRFRPTDSLWEFWHDDHNMYYSHTDTSHKRAYDIFYTLCGQPTSSYARDGIGRVSVEDIINKIANQHCDIIKSYVDFYSRIFDIFRDMFYSTIPSPEEIVDIIRTTPDIHDKIRHVMDNELDMIERIRPNHTKNWVLLQKLYT